MLPLLLEIGDRGASLEVDFQGSSGPSDIRPVDAISRERIDGGEHGSSLGLGHALDLPLDLFAGLGGFEEPVEERFYIEVGAANDDGCDGLSLKIFDQRVGEFEPIMNSETGLEIHKVEQVVWDSIALLDGGLGGANVQVRIDLVGVRGDDLPIEAMGELYSKGGFNARGWSDDDRVAWV